MAYNGPLPQVVKAGGTGLATLTAHDVLIGAGTSNVSLIAPSATSGVPLISQGASADPTFGTAVVAGGGTGAVTLTGVLTGNGTSAITANAVTQHGVVIGGASNAVSSTSVGATGTVLAGSTGADPSFTATPTVTSISFGGTALANYVQGTFTPVLAFGGASVGITYTTQSGVYTQIGNVVYINIRINLSSQGSSTGAATITGLPVTSAASPINYKLFSAFVNLTAAPAGTTFHYSALPNSSTTLTLTAENGATTAATGFVDTNFSNTAIINIEGFYFV